MPIPISMPALSPTMTEGKLVRWMKAEGEAVAPGDLLAEIETDKATMEVEAVDEGVLGRILVPEGAEGVPVNAPIAVLLLEGEDSGALDAAGFAAPAPAAPAPAPAAPATSAPAPSAGPAPVHPGSLAPPPAAPAPAPVSAAPAAPASGGRVFASPLARRMAAQAGIDLAGIAGGGPNGRIVKADIEAAIAGRAARPAAATAPVAATAAPAPAPAAAPGAPEYDEIPNTTMRKVIARRLSESKRDAPHFYMTIDCEIDALLDIRRKLNEAVEDGRISVNDMVVRAAALALKRVPAANASWTGEAIRVYRSVDISVAVAVEGGLVTPVVRGAQNKGLAEIAAETRDFAARARAGRLMPEDYMGGTFSISNLGMYGVREFAAVINPPQGAILAVGAGEKRPVVRDDALAIATVMSCTLSADHRVVDGAAGAEFLAAFRKLIENPLSMLL